jgi:hypothetical protein
MAIWIWMQVALGPKDHVPIPVALVQVVVVLQLHAPEVPLQVAEVLAELVEVAEFSRATRPWMRFSVQSPVPNPRPLFGRIAKTTTTTASANRFHLASVDGNRAR